MSIQGYRTSQIIGHRQQKGLAIARIANQIKKIGGSIYSVKSQTTKSMYTVKCSESVSTCTCPDHKFRGIDCKHIWAVAYFLL